MSNISEKLEFSFEDGEEIRPELEKEAEKKNKENEKGIEELKDIVDDINNAECEKPEFKDGEGKKIKFITEKLTLEESDLVEAPIPRDLSKAYKKAKNYHTAKYDDYDLQKADYTLITPEDAFKQIKAGNAKDIRLLVDNRLITLRDNGYGDLENRNRYVDYEKGYRRKNGELLTDTAHLPVKHLLSIADKIYLTNENNIKKDPDLLAARAKNPESPNNDYGYSRGLKELPYTNLVGSSSTLRGGSQNPAIFSRSSIDNLNNYDFKRIKNELIKLNKDFKNGVIGIDEYKGRVDELKDSYRFRSGVEKENSLKDSRARARYYNSEINLREPFDTYSELKGALRHKDTEIENAKERIDRIKNNGSATTNRYKDTLVKYEKELDDIIDTIATLKMRLRYADENDKEALEKANQEYNNIISNYADKQAEFDKLLRRSTESYEPWGDAVKTYNKIVEANLIEDFNDLIDSLYPEGLTESRKNDMLLYKTDMILEMLDLSEDKENE